MSLIKRKTDTLKLRVKIARYLDTFDMLVEIQHQIDANLIAVDKGFIMGTLYNLKTRVLYEAYSLYKNRAIALYSEISSELEGTVLKMTSSKDY